MNIFFNKKSKIAYEGLKYTAILIIFIYAFHLINEKYALLNFDNSSESFNDVGRSKIIFSLIVFYSVEIIIGIVNITSTC